jgi:hypothetical protein
MYALIIEPHDSPPMERASIRNEIQHTTELSIEKVQKRENRKSLFSFIFEYRNTAIGTASPSL